jgi:hypothetical protein
MLNRYETNDNIKSIYYSQFIADELSFLFPNGIFDIVITMSYLLL